MGVHGLTTFLRERRSTLSKTILFPAHDGQVTPLVVDGWSFIYKVLEDSGLPWVYGGEYEAFAGFIVNIVRAWIGVGLRPIFVFDGSIPLEKFRTVIQRRNEGHVQQALLFFRTSAVSRNTRRFLNEARIIPPLALAVCVHVLLSLRGGEDGADEISGKSDEGEPIEVHFADEEADPYAVELAGRLAAYVTGRDSDFVVLNSEGYLGYLPLEEMLWLASDSKTEQTVDEVVEDGFQPVKKKKRTAPERAANSGIIPPDSTELSLSASLYTPATLTQHLNLPVSLLPLLGALVGNDYTLQPGDRPTYRTNPKAIQSLLFERRLTYSQRITHASATLNTLLRGQTGRRKQRKPKSVMELIEMTVGALALISGAPSALVGPDQQAAMVETIVEGTLPYAMPLRPGEDAYLSSTVCALHLPHECRLVAQMDRTGMDGSSTYSETVSALYLRAYRQGRFSPSLMNIFSTRTFWPDVFLENPDVETVPRSISRHVRQFSYALLEHGAVIPAPVMQDQDEVVQDEEDADMVTEDPDELVDVMEDTDDDYGYEDDISDDVDKLRGQLKQLQFEGDEQMMSTSSLENGAFAEDSVDDSVCASSSVRSPAPLQRPTLVKKQISARRKVVTEYVRRGARIVPEEIEVSALDQLDVLSAYEENESMSIPLQLRSETERLEVFCRFLHTNPQDILSLSKADRMPVLALRLVIHRMHRRAEEAPNSKERQLEKWARKEAHAFLASVSRSGSENSLDPPVEISDRSVQLTAQVLTALECIEHVVQVLLLTDMIPDCAHRFSGLRFHSLLASNGEAGVAGEVWQVLSSGLEVCFAEERQGKKARRKAQKESANSKATVPAKGRGKMTATNSLYSLLADIPL